MTREDRAFVDYLREEQAAREAHDAPQCQCGAPADLFYELDDGECLCEACAWRITMFAVNEALLAGDARRGAAVDAYTRTVTETSSRGAA